MNSLTKKETTFSNKIMFSYAKKKMYSLNTRNYGLVMQYFKNLCEGVVHLYIYFLIKRVICLRRMLAMKN